MFQFVLDINHWNYAGWNKHEKQCQLELQTELGKTLAELFAHSTETSAVAFKLMLSFSDKNATVSFDPIVRVAGQLYVAGGLEVDWRALIQADFEQIKTFIAQASVTVIRELIYGLELSADDLEKKLSALSLQTGISYDAVSRNKVGYSFESSESDPVKAAASERLRNRIGINIALSNGDKGDNIDAKFISTLLTEMENLQEVKQFAVQGAQTGNGFFSVELTTHDPIGLGDELVPWLRMMKLNNGSTIDAFFRNGRMIEMKRADIGRNAEALEKPSDQKYIATRYQLVGSVPSTLTRSIVTSMPSLRSLEPPL